jgi:hypothetical protein
MTGTADAVARYHALLDGPLAAECHGWLDRECRVRGLVFGDRPLATVLRPRFLSVARYRELAARSAAVLRAFETVRRAAMADPVVRARFHLEPWEERLVHVDAGFPAASPTARLDAFWGPTGLWFTEYNAETPAGAAYNDALAELFGALPVMAGFSNAYHAWPLPAAPGVVHALLGAFRAWGGGGAPTIAIVDWEDVPTRTEFELFRERFERLGLECVIADPRACEFEGGTLWAGGVAVSLVYKRVLLHELVDRCGEDTPVLAAARARAVCLVNPPTCKLLHKKASLAAVHDERHAPLLDAEAAAAVRAHVPWTRVVEERVTEKDGAPVDLVPWVAAHRESLVLKPNDEYGGKGVVLGWTVDDAAWGAALRDAVTRPTIVQERIALPSEPFPAWDGAGLAVSDRLLDTAPFVRDGAAVDGCLTRIASDPLLNVTAGGGSNVPTFLLEAR